jgi:hypothetical protein
MTMSGVTSVNTAGSKKLPSNLYVDGGRRASRRSRPGALLDGVGDVRLDLSTAFMSISGPITAPGSNPSATFIAPAVSASRLVKAS